MSCDFFERHFLVGGDPPAFEEHRRACAECRAAASGWIDLDRTCSRIEPPAVPGTAWQRWREIPSRTVDCDRAGELSARSIEEALAEPDVGKLDFHLSRCEACRETAAVLRLPSELQRPAPPAERPIRPPAPVVSFAEARRKRAARTAGWSDPRLYAAAACFLAGFVAFFANTVQTGSAASSAVSVTGDLQNSLRVRWAEAVDRVQIWEEGLSRQWVATRETLTGYTRAAGAIALSAAGRATEGFLRNETKSEKGKKS